MDNSSLISTIGAVAAIASAVYAYFQAKQAKENVEQAKKIVVEASTQNRISALIALKSLYEEMLPEIKRQADHFSAPETYESVGKPLYDEHEEYRKKLQKIKAEIDKLYESYIPTNKSGSNK
jgi:ribosomal protein L7/L12